MKGDPSLIKPGWSLSKLRAFDCPFRGYKLYGENRKEPAGDFAIIGSLVAIGMAELRTRWLESGAECHIGHLNKIIAGAAVKENATEEHVQKAQEIVYTGMNHLRLLPDRSTVSRYWIEERLAFTKQWDRIEFSAKDAQWWGSADQRNKTWFRCVPDFAWLDTDGVLHVEDDKSSWGKPDRDQVLAYGHALSKLLGRNAPDRIECRFNLLAQKKFSDVVATEPADVAGFPKWLETKVEAITSRTDFPPILGKGCDWCGFKDECPALVKTAGELATVKPDSFRVPQTVEEIQRGALWLMTAQEAVRIAKQCLEDGMKALNASSVAIPGTGKELRWNASAEWEAETREALNAMVPHVVSVVGEDPDAIRSAILGAFTFRKGQVEDVAKNLWPLSGKGITAEVKGRNSAARNTFLEDVLKVGTEKPRKSTFGVFSEKEAA